MAAGKPTVLRLIVGLGNPGNDYVNTRHNVGFAAIDLLAAKWGVELKEKGKFKGLFATCNRGGSTLYLLKPTTYMNLSGESVLQVANMFRIPPEEIVVVTDDVNIPLGEMRFKDKGGSGGHNGLKSIRSVLGTEAFPRLRLGVSAPQEGELTNFVLGRFKSSELEALEAMLEKACLVLEDLVKGKPYHEVMQSANERRRKDRDNEQTQEN